MHTLADGDFDAQTVADTLESVASWTTSGEGSEH